MKPIKHDRIPEGEGRGFTLMEVIMVLGVLGFLLGMAAPGAVALHRWMAERETRFLYSQWESACRLYRLENGKWPVDWSTGEQRLNHPAGRWRKELAPYLERPFASGQLKDGFGNTDIRIILDSDGDHWISGDAFIGLAEAERPDRVWARVVLYSLTPDGRLASASWRHE